MNEGIVAVVLICVAFLGGVFVASQPIKPTCLIVVINGEPRVLEIPPGKTLLLDLTVNDCDDSDLADYWKPAGWKPEM